MTGGRSAGCRLAEVYEKSPMALRLIGLGKRCAAWRCSLVGAWCSRSGPGLRSPSRSPVGTQFFAISMHLLVIGLHLFAVGLHFLAVSLECFAVSFDRTAGGC
jgi:hypothetical protein